MESGASKILSQRLKEAASVGNKLHVIFRSGEWVIIKENSKRALGKFKIKQDALQKAAHILQTGRTDGLIIHRADGSVENLYPFIKNQVLVKAS